MPRPQGLCTFCSLFLLYSFCQYLWVLLPHMFLPFYFFPLKVFPMKPTQSLHIQSHITCTSGTPPSLFHILFIFSCNSLSFYVSFYKDNNCLLYLLLCPLYLEQCWSHIWCLIHISWLIIKTSKFPCFLNFVKHRLVLLCRNSAMFLWRHVQCHKLYERIAYPFWKKGRNLVMTTAVCHTCVPICKGNGKIWKHLPTYGFK